MQCLGNNFMMVQIHFTLLNICNRPAMFDSSDFKKLEKDVDAFSIMTYDYSQTGR